MIQKMLRGFPMSAHQPLRQAVHDFPRGHPVRLAATAVLQRALHAHRHHLPDRLAEIRPLDAVHWFGVRGYEGTVARVWAGLCAASGSVLEIGGNVGLFTVGGGSRAAGAYTVVEPVPANAATLRANLARNGLARVELLEAAVVPGEVRRDVVLNLPDEGRAMPVGAHLMEEVEIAGRAGKIRITVPGLPMRELAAGRDLIKIDAEGIEAALLAGIRPLLVAQRPTLMDRGPAGGRAARRAAVQPGHGSRIPDARPDGVRIGPSPSPRRRSRPPCRRPTTPRMWSCPSAPCLLDPQWAPRRCRWRPMAGRRAAAAARRAAVPMMGAGGKQASADPLMSSIGPRPPAEQEAGQGGQSRRALAGAGPAGATSHTSGLRLLSGRRECQKRTSAS